MLFLTLSYKEIQDQSQDFIFFQLDLIACGHISNKIRDGTRIVIGKNFRGVLSTAGRSFAL